jgi:hypothetical protein
MATKSKKTVGASKEARTLDINLALVGSNLSINLEEMIFQANNYMQTIRPRLMADFGVCESSTTKDVNAFDEALRDGRITLKKGDWIAFQAHKRLYPLVKGRMADLAKFEKLSH